MKALALAALPLLAACASNPSEIQPAYVSPVKYQDYTCEQLSAELRAVESRMIALHNELKSERATDETQTAVGLILFWPALLLLEGGDGPEAAEYARLKGEYTALLTNAGRCTDQELESPTDDQETGYRRLGTPQDQG